MKSPKHSQICLHLSDNNPSFSRLYFIGNLIQFCSPVLPLVFNSEFALLLERVIVSHSIQSPIPPSSVGLHYQRKPRIVVVVSGRIRRRICHRSRGSTRTGTCTLLLSYVKQCSSTLVDSSSTPVYSSTLSYSCS